MDSEVKYLKGRYREDPSAEKRVKFSDIEDDLVQQFPSISYSAKRVSQVVSSAFPKSVSKKCGKKRHKYLYGIDAFTNEEQESPPSTSHGACAMTSSSEMLEIENKELKVKVQLLQAQVAELEEKVRTFEVKDEELDWQMQRALHADNTVVHGPNTIEHFGSFSIDTVIQDLKQCAPDVYRLFSQLARTDRHDDEQESSCISQLRAVTSLCTLLKGRSTKVLGVQLLITFMLLARATSRQAITVLNHAGVCISYTGAWKYLKQLTVEAHFLDIVREGHWLWLYDNLNIHMHIRHEREDHHSSMMNVTSRLAFKVENFPDFPFSWSDTTPQCSRQSLIIEDYLPSESESSELENRAVYFIMEFLIKMFPSLQDLKSFVPERKTLHQCQKSQVVPMKLLFRDEKYKSETIEILSQLAKDANLNADSQIVVGDQLTCKNIRGCKLWRQPEVDPKERLGWAKEMPGDFHFLWECLRVLYLIFWGSPTHQGSLCNMRDLIKRTQVDKKVKIFSVADEFIMHTFTAHLTARICTLLKITSPTDVIPHPCTSLWLRSTAEKLSAESLKAGGYDDPVYCLHRTFLHMAFLYADLRNAIRWQNGPNIITHWKLWLPRFIATGCRNYASESVHLITNLCSDFPAHIAYIATHNRTVNTEGIPGRGKPLDQMVEHYNLVLKQAMKSGGGNITEKHAEELSLSALFLMEAAKKADKEFHAHRTTAHTTRDADKDILKITTHLLDNQVTSVMEDRTTPTFKDPTDDGMAKMCNTSWVKEILAKSADDDLDEEQREYSREVDLDYEIFDC